MGAEGRCREEETHGERYRDRDNTDVIARAKMDRRLKRDRDSGRRLREMEGCREAHVRWERHNDSDTEIMKTRERVVHEKRWARAKEKKDT